jgi:hypothetical protein
MIDGEGGHPSPTRHLAGGQCSGILTCLSRTSTESDDEASRWHGPQSPRAAQPSTDRHPFRGVESLGLQAGEETPLPPFVVAGRR